MSLSGPGKNSPHTQDCQHFFKRKCGGCSFLHIPYADQLAAKQQQVAGMLQSTFRSLSGRKKPDLKVVLRDIVPSHLAMGYRASAKFTLHEDKSGRKTVGLFTQGTRTVVSTTGCPANSELVNKLTQTLFANIADTDLKCFDHSTTTFQKNRLKYLTIRTSPSTGTMAHQTAIIISHTGIDKQALIKWIEATGLDQLCAYESRLTKEDGEALMGRLTKHLSGPKTFPYLLTDRTFRISPVSFFQANHSLAADLIKCATSFQKKGGILLDLYGGFGAYSFAVKDIFKEIIVVDGNPAAIQAAHAHAVDHGITHLIAVNESCETYLEKRMPLETANRITHLIVNPSRTGMSVDVIKSISLETLPLLQELHYISCSPPTFARDALSLIGSGLTLTEVVPFDMFPQTDHVELVGKFMRAPIF